MPAFATACLAVLVATAFCLGVGLVGRGPGLTSRLAIALSAPAVAWAVAGAALGAWGIGPASVVCLVVAGGMDAGLVLALRRGVAGPLHQKTACMHDGAPACVYDLSWEPGGAKADGTRAA